jgi:hypothetical protein
MAYSKEQIINEIRAIAKKLGKNSLKSREWKKNSSISLKAVENKFNGWTNAVLAAGLKPVDSSQVTKDALTIDDSDLLSELIRLQKKHGKITETLVNSKGKYSTRPYKNRWKTIKAAIAEAQNKLHSGELIIEDVFMDVQDNHEDNPSTSNSINVGSAYGLHVPNEKLRSKKRSVVGEPIDFRGMRFAPVNEQGVVYLFGMVSQELGFLIESVRVQYPDCEGKRCCDPKANLWEHIYIEFEYKSSNFTEHGHNIEDCELIVCWIHDWKDCPLEVLELREAIRTLPRKGRTK